MPIMTVVVVKQRCAAARVLDRTVVRRNEPHLQSPSRDLDNTSATQLHTVPAYQDNNL